MLQTTQRSLVALFLLAAPGLAWPSVRTTGSWVEYPCDAKKATYDVPFQFLEVAHLVVQRIPQDQPQRRTTLRPGSDYTVAGAGTGGGGVVTLAAPASTCGPGELLRIGRSTPLRQQPVVRGTQLDAEGLEATLDRLTLRLQEVGEGAARELEEGSTLVRAAGAPRARSLGARFADVVNVRDFGAAGDGKTDDTAAVRAAYGVAKERGGTIFFPPGTYRFNLLVTDRNVRIVGAGFGDENRPGATVFRPQDPAAPAIQIGDGSAPVSSIELSHFSLIGDGSTAGSDGLVIVGAAHVSVHHVWISAFGRDNISITSSATQPTQFVYLADFMSKWARGAGLRAVYGAQWTTAIDLANFTISGGNSPSAWAMYLDGVTLQAVNGYMDVHGDHGMYLKRSNKYPAPGLRGAQIILDVAKGEALPAATFDATVSQSYVGSYITGTSFSVRSLAHWLSNGARIAMGTESAAERRLVEPHILGKLTMARRGMPGSLDLENTWGRLTLEDYSGRNPYWNFNTDTNDYRVAFRVGGSRQYPLQFNAGSSSLYVDPATKQLIFARGTWWPDDGAPGAALGMHVSPPSSPRSDCQPGEFATDRDYLYVCIAAGNWRRASLGTW